MMPASETLLRVAVISDGFPLWPLQVARSTGLFRREGVEVALTVTASSAKQIDGLERGDFDIGIQLPDHIVRSVARGADLFAFMAPAHALDIGFIASADIASLRGLKGRAIAVDGARSGYALLLRRLLRSEGLDDADYRLVEFGGTRERADALADKRAEAGFINPPFDRQLLARGFVRLTSTLEAFPAYPGVVAAARRSWAGEHAALLTGFIRAYRNAFAWLGDPRNREAAIDLACAWLCAERAAAGAAWEDFACRPEPALAADGMRQVIDVVWDDEGFSSPEPNADRFLDLSYLERARHIVGGYENE